MLRSILLLFVVFLVAIEAEIISVDGLRNCHEVPANISDISTVGVKFGLDPETIYVLFPVKGAIMYFPGNDNEPYDHYSYAISITPDSCGMGLGGCGSSNEFTCCQYTTDILGTPPALLHGNSSSMAFEENSGQRVYITGYSSYYAWIQDDNCSNNSGQAIFDLIALSSNN
eukprot:TRINITY_DN15787_c0_g1_i1.p1 TRINITY_DN15787_c0_g1~~TRINITY_DN15787_c0_g1_i1.p1  ORF type:complete len:171 (+),score=56.05 TRINITY_DN15787_c0_g1_i1:74-586(+)